MYCYGYCPRVKYLSWTDLRGTGPSATPPPSQNPKPFVFYSFVEYLKNFLTYGFWNISYSA